MPAGELGASFESPNGVHIIGNPLFKRHKTLPHPRENRVQHAHISLPATGPQDVTISAATSSRSSSDTSPRTLKHSSRRIGPPVLPPTPPPHSHKSSAHSSAAPAPVYEVAGKSPTAMASAPGTPPNQRSPPTPDVTPPRAMPLTFRPPRSDRYLSSQSRSDSFRTARENPYSSDEDGGSTLRPVLPVTRPADVEVTPPRLRSENRKEVGLGLGLESDNEGTATPKASTGSQQEFLVFDGEWGSAEEETSEVEREWDDNLMRNVTVRKRPTRKPYRFTDGATDEVLEDDIIPPTNATKVVRGLPLQERISRHRSERDAKNLGEPMVWPSAVPDSDSPATPDVRRFSAASGRSTSTVIEAMVVDTVPAQKKTLRRSKKLLGLRDLGDQSATTSTTSVISSEPRRQLSHKKSKTSEKGHRCLASNTTVNSSGKSRREVINNGGIPVVVIPDRRSSANAKSSKPPSLRSTSSRRTKRTVSLSSAPVSQSSKFNEPGYLDSHPVRRRTMSESDESYRSVRTIDFPPNIPARRSSLSAPTSRNTSRAGSLTAESLKAHNLIQNQEAAKAEILQSPQSESQDVGQSTNLNVDLNGDPFFGNRLSTQVTPFSQSSHETAGTTAVVSEAMAVSIYPHQNKSVLVVGQQGAPQPSTPEPGAVDGSQPEMAGNHEPTTGPVTPPRHSNPMDEVDSPLRNPRAPPVPPEIKFIPPTPASVPPGQDEDRQLGYEQEPATSDNKPRRSLSLVRRAFSNRRNSEPTIQPWEGLLKRTFSLSSRHKDLVDTYPRSSPRNVNPSTLYPSVSSRPPDSTKLHPFWRPSHFWDDLEDYDEGSDEFRNPYPIIDNRPKRSLSGKLKRTFAILPSKEDYAYPSYSPDRRTVRRTPSGNMRVVKHRSNSSLRREASVRRRHGAGESGEEPFGYGFPYGNGGRSYHTIPGLGLRVEYVGWSEMKRRLSERKREQRSEKLRAIISPPRGVQDGINDVLRRRAEA